MPEYLAPGVYIEEIPSGNQPIQAASTSTAGMVGMTARGPVNRPTLVTSRGAYVRLFGGDLDPLAFPGGRDALPYAAEGFFVNGGARLYVVRIVGDDAAGSSLKVVARAGAATMLAAGAAAGQKTVLVTDPAALKADDRILIAGGGTTETATVAADPVQARPALGGGLRRDYPVGATVTVQTPTALAGAPAGALAAGATTIVVTDVTGITAAGTLLLAGAPAGGHELVAVTAVDTATKTLTLARPLRLAYATATLSTLADGTPVAHLRSAAGHSDAPVFLDLDNAAGVDPGEVVRLVSADVAEFALVTGVAHLVTLKQDTLVANHTPGAEVTPVAEVLTVHARWPGGWGDSLRVTASAASLAATVTTAATPVGTRSVAVATPFGLYPGSVLVFTGGPTVEVAAVDTDTRVVTLAAPVAAEIPAGAALASREFTLLVERLDGDRAAESELFERLSLATGHARYAPTVVGSWDAATTTPSDSGASGLVRLSDESSATTRMLPMVASVPRLLAGGRDDVAHVDDDTYVGTPADDPDQRTGIQALENEPTLSIVAVPGQTSLTVQGALVDHCEKMRYRFAVLDVPRDATLDGARGHRQNFDTTRAALYYPDLAIADRFGAAGDRRIIAPSGHVAGIYARTDITRGVHKAPANEVVRGALGLRVALSKGEQDILNPINLNCLRDFRSQNRGLRVYGARVATSDPEWKYVNVRRLLLFIEQSLDTGLQWAVFEPNDKPLWDTVKQSITGFLTTVWRSGALEGTKPEEAFFVNIGYDVTMTQTDIDNGLLVVEVGVAPVKPAEFVVVRISQKTREATA